MIIHHNQADWVSESTTHTCPFHEANPGVQYAGCTCGGSYSQRRKTVAEKMAEQVNVFRGGGLRRVGDVSRCIHREHKPPMHISLQPGRYEWTCPGCGFVTAFTVNGPVW